MVHAGRHPCSNVHESGSPAHRVMKSIYRFVHEDILGLGPKQLASIEIVMTETPLEHFPQGLQNSEDLAVLAWFVAACEDRCSAKNRLAPFEQRGMLAGPCYLEAASSLEEMRTSISCVRFCQGHKLHMLHEQVQDARVVLDAWFGADQAWLRRAMRTLRSRLPDDTSGRVARFLSPQEQQLHEDSVDESAFARSFCAENELIEHVNHADSAAVIDPAVAETAVELEWADRVENQLAVQHAEPCFSQQEHQLGKHSADEEFSARSCFAENGVIENVTHVDLAAVIDLAVAETAVELPWIGRVENQFTSQNASSGVILLRYGNAPKTDKGWRAFEDALMHGTPLQTCRAGLSACGFAVELPCHAKVLCSPDMYAAVLDAAAIEDLRAFHVLITPEFEPALQETLDGLAYNLRPREKRKDRRKLAVNMSGCKPLPSDHEASIFSVFEVKRTFLHFPAVRCRPTTDVASVVQSTTDGHCDDLKRPENHRKLECGSNI